MSLTTMKFNKTWLSKTDFPTHETHEEQVRADMQYLFDSIKDQFNNFISNELSAENVSFAPIGSVITASNVQAAIQAVHQEVLDISQGGVSDGAITTAKLDQTEGEEAVTTSTIRDGAITTDKIADGAITSEKIQEGAISAAVLEDGSINRDKMGLQSVETNALAPYCVTDGKLANDAVIERTIKNGNVTADKLAANAVTTAKILNANVTADKLATNSVTTLKIADLNVTTDKLAEGAVTLAKTTGIQQVHSTTTTTLAANTTAWTKTGITGVTATNTVICTPDPASFTAWVDNRVRCTGQGSESLTFAADTSPTTAITVNVLILNK